MRAVLLFLACSALCAFGISGEPPPEERRQISDQLFLRALTGMERNGLRGSTLDEMVRAAQSGHVAAYMMLARYGLNGNFAHDLERLREAARLGDAYSQLQVERSLKNEDAEGQRWLRSAAEQGYLLALFLLTARRGGREHVEANTQPRLTKNCQLVYVNGVNTSAKEHLATLNLLRFIFNCDDMRGLVKVDGVHLNKITAAKSVALNVVDMKAEEITPLVLQIEKLVINAIKEDRLPVLLGHSWGNVVIGNFIEQHPELADRVHVIAMGSPTRAIQSKNVTHIVEENDPVTWLGALTRFSIATNHSGESVFIDGASASMTGSVLAAKSGMKRLPLPDIEGAFQSIIAKINEKERQNFSPYKIVFFTNPLLGRDRVNESFEDFMNYVEFAPQLVPMTRPIGVLFGKIRPFLQKGFKYKALLEKHGVVLSYLSGPGLEQFRNVFHDIAESERVPRDGLPPLPATDSPKTAPAQPDGGVEGAWSRYVNGRWVGVYIVSPKEGGGYQFVRVESGLGAWLPLDTVKNLSFSGDRWEFDAEQTGVHFDLRRQEAGTYAGLVQGNQNIWQRVEVSPPEPADPEERPILEMINDTIDIIGSPTSIMYTKPARGQWLDDGTPLPEPKKPAPPPEPASIPEPDPQPIPEPELRQVLEPPAALPSSSPLPQPERQERPKPPPPNVPSIAGLWRVSLDGTPQYDVAVRESGMEVRVDTAASDGYPRFDVPRYYGDRWEFNRHEGGKTVRITLHRAGMEEFTGTVDGAPYRWVRLDQNPDASVTPIPRQADEEKAAPPDEAAWKAAERKQKRKEFDDFMNLTVDDL